jgi:hypothetical protein
LGQVYTIEQWMALIASKLDWDADFDAMLAEYKAGTLGSGGGGGSGAGPIAVNALEAIENVVTVAVTASAVSTVTLTSNVTLHLTTAAPAGQKVTTYLYSTQGGTGSYTITPPGNARLQGGFLTSLSTAVAATDEIEITTLDGGASWLFTLTRQFAP